MRIAVVLVLIASLSRSARAEEHLPWYRGFYGRVGGRHSDGVQESFHNWPAFSFGIGYRYASCRWALDASVLDVQFDPEEGMHTLVRLLPTILLPHEMWAGLGLSYGWVKGTVYEAIAKRTGEGLQGEVAAGIELPRRIHVRSFIQATLTLPFYNTYDTVYHSRDSKLYVFAYELALGIRF